MRLILVVLPVLTALPTLAQTADLPDRPETPSQPQTLRDAAAPAVADDGSTMPDFAALDKTALVLLCQQYYRMNRLLEQRLAQQQPAAAPVADAGSLAALEAQMARLEERLSVWMASAAQSNSDAVVLVNEDTLGQPITPTPAYRYEYELKLIGERGSTRMIRRDAEGKLHVEKVSFSDYRSDEIEVRVFFRNDSDRRARFNMLVGLGERRGMLGSLGNRATLVGRDSYTTPFLVPGEVHPFTLRIPVDNAYQVDFAEIGKVRAFE